MPLYPPTIQPSGVTPCRSLTMTNEFGALLLMDGLTPDANGTTWCVESMDGWEGDAIRQTQYPIPGFDGTYQSPWYYDAKTVTINGVCWALSTGQCQLAADSLGFASASTRNPGLLRVIDVSGTDRLLSVRRSGHVKWNQTHEIAEWEVIMSAADPLRYLTTPGSAVWDTAHPVVVANNAGTYPSSNIAWTAVVSGTTTGLQLQNNTPVYVGSSSGGLLKWDFTFINGDVVAVAWYPPHSMFLLRSGVLIDLRPALDPASVWWPLAIGANILQLNTSSGSVVSGNFGWYSAVV